MIEEEKTVLFPQALEHFVETPYVQDICNRALNYIAAGFPMHFRGPAGTGKTTLAKHLAGKLQRPVVMLHGDEEFSTSNLIGSDNGYHTKRVRDNFVSRVLKEEEMVTKHWVDNRLTVACRYGFTLIYDEFTRSRPEANNVLLSVLEEGMINLPVARGGENPYLKVHPNFTAIFTSNPEEYAGVYRSQDALRDRMITLDLDYFDYETEVSITAAKSGLPREEAALIVNVVRGLRETGKCEFSPTVRGAIMIAKTMHVMRLAPSASVEMFTSMAQDILASETSRVGSRINQERIKKIIRELIAEHVGAAF